MKVGFSSLGCPKNLIDSEVMIGLVAAAGHELTQDPAIADVLVVNTCAFIDAAKAESIEAILEMAEHKRGGSCKRLVVTGCLGERYRDELRAEMPDVDVVLGTRDVPDIVRAVEGAAVAGSPVTFFRNDAERRQRQTGAAPARRSAYLYDADTPRVTTTPRHFAYLKIAEGCDYKCSFCIIPQLRGTYRSRSEESIVREAEALAASGVQELVLVSQDTTFYGIDRGERGALGRLLRRLNQVDGLRWIRLLYLYPTTLTDETIDAIAECGKVCKYIDMPLQHASRPVLQRMKRPGSREGYERLIERVRRRIPDVALRTAFIVGFPGETEDDLRELCDFIRANRFEHVGVFTYSHEEGTTAFALRDDVPAKVKRARRDRVMATQLDVLGSTLASRVRRQVRVLIEEVDERRGRAMGRTEGQAPTIDSVTYLRGPLDAGVAVGSFVDAEIVGVEGYDLVAEVVRPAGRRGADDWQDVRNESTIARCPDTRAAMTAGPRSNSTSGSRRATPSSSGCRSSGRSGWSRRPGSTIPGTRRSTSRRAG